MPMHDYLDIEGVVHESDSVNKHHVFPRCKAVGRLATKFINQYGLVLPMLKTFHNEGDEALHNNVRLAPMPSPELMNRINDFTMGLVVPNAYDRFLVISDRIESMSHSPHAGVARECGKIADNLQQQTPYILLGQVQRL